MTTEEIRSAYLKSIGRSLPDLNEIRESRIYKMLKSVYFSSFKETAGSQDNINLQFDVLSPFGLFDDPKSLGYRNVGIRRRYTEKKSSLLINGERHIQITLTKSDSVPSDFDSLVSRYLRENVVNFRGDIPDDQKDLSISILQIITGEKESIEDIILDIREKDPVLFSKAVNQMDKSGVFPEIVQKFKEKDSRLLRGGRLLGGLGF